MAEEKQYAPGLYLRARTTQHGEMLSVSIDCSKFVSWMEQHMDQGNIRLTIARRREPGVPKRDLTHNAWLDTWKPTRQTEQPAPATQPEKPKLELPEDDVPF
jgi:hypothetical protein